MQATWDSHSLLIRDERIMLFSGEFHPFRLPVPGLWLDIFQKIKAMGFTAVSFYTDSGLLQGNPSGEVVTDGIWALDEFFRAASEAGLYLIARPGPAQREGDNPLHESGLFPRRHEQGVHGVCGEAVPGRRDCGPVHRE